MKKSCEAFLLKAAAAGHLVAALMAPTPSTLATAPVPTSVVVTRVAVEVARTRLLAKSVVNTAAADAATPVGLKKVLSERPPLENMLVLPFPPSVNTLRLGKMPRRRLLLRSATYAVPKGSTAIPRG